ncbi:MAG TPA: pitrilysin family protein [Polyangium sp.]|nr:pitrilysin family protein [Polyangium sp.]
MLIHHDLVLSSGLPVVVVPQSNVHRAVAALFLRVGARYETPETNGLSHFLEHMTFRGTRTYPSAHTQALAFERLGGTLFAATSVDHGVMSIAVPPRNFERVIDLLGEVTTTPRFTEVEIERGIVREEILEDLDDDGRVIDADDLARKLIFEDHPLGYRITGGLENLARFDEPMLRAHHARHYTTTNALLCLAGNFDVKTGVAAAERAFATMPKGAKVTSTSPTTGQTKARFQFVKNQSSQTDLRIAFRAVSEHDSKEPAVEMLLRVLDDGMSTRLYERICDRLGLCYDVSGMFESYEDDGVVDISAGTAHERATLVLKELFALVGELAGHGPTQEELDKAKDRHLWSVEAMEDDPEEVAGFYGLSALTEASRTPMARHERLADVTVADVRDAAQRIFCPERMGVVAVGMLKRSEETKMEKVVQGFGRA